MSTDLSPTPSLAHVRAELHAAPAPRVPALFCPFEPAIHADVDAVQSASVAWAHAQGLVVGERAEKRLHASKIAWLVSRAYPRGGLVALQIAADWTTLFCLLDDHIEPMESPAAVQDYLFQLLAVAHGASPWTADPARRAMADIRRRLGEIAGPAAMGRIEDRIAELIHAFCREAEVRHAREIPVLSAYLPMREITVGIPVEAVIGELVDGIDLADTLRDLRPMRALLRMASNLVGWANDIYTFEKELREGEPCNLVAVLARARGLSLHEAVTRAAAMHDAEARRFVALLEEVSYLGCGAARYADMLRCWVRGHLDWARETGRYVAPIVTA